MKKLQQTLLFRLLLTGLFIFLWIPAHFAAGSACCGGNFAAPGLILGDEKAQLTATLVQSQTMAEVSQKGRWYPSTNNKKNSIYKLEGSHIFKDVFQAGAILSFLKTAEDSQPTSPSLGLGDLVGQIGYEFLSDWDYHPWRPKGLAFLQITAPTGKYSRSFSNENLGSSPGNGFWILGLGTTFVKNLGVWDLNSTVELHQALPRKKYITRLYENSGTQTPTKTAEEPVSLNPAMGGSLRVGGGWNSSSLRLGTALVWHYESGTDLSGAIESKKSLQRYATTQFSVSYLWSQTWASSLTYSDQTMLGHPLHTSLDRSLTFSLQRRWGR